MPACFQLIDRVTGEAEKFNVVDDKLCAALGVVPDEKKYYWGWYDTIGFLLAIGKTWDEVRAESVKYEDHTMTKIVDWMREHYESSAWYQRHKE